MLSICKAPIILGWDGGPINHADLAVCFWSLIHFMFNTRPIGYIIEKACIYIKIEGKKPFVLENNAQEFLPVCQSSISLPVLGASSMKSWRRGNRGRGADAQVE